MKFKFTIKGLDCPNCAAKLAGLFVREDGIQDAKINFLTEKLTVESTLDEAALVSTLARVAKGFEDGIVIE